MCLFPDAAREISEADDFNSQENLEANAHSCAKESVLPVRNNNYVRQLHRNSFANRGLVW